MSDFDLDAAIRNKTAAVRAFKESDAMLQVHGLLDLIEQSYKEQLADVSTEDLHRVQGALKQTSLLRQSIFGPEGMVPRL